MKIIFLTPEVPPAVNGVGEYTVQLARELRRLGHDARVLTSRGQVQTEEWIHPVISFWNGKEVLAAAGKAGVDWFILQYVPQMYGRRGVCLQTAGLPGFLKKHTGARIAVTFHEFQSALWKRNALDFFLSAILRFQTARMVQNCDAAVTTCGRYGEILRAYPGGSGKTSVIPVGAGVLPDPDAENARVALRHKHGIGEEGRVLAVFGRLASFRQTGLAIRALAEGRAKGLKAFLFLIGGMRSSSPEIFYGLEALAKKLGVQNWMVETGDLSAPDVSCYLTASDVFLFPQIDGVSTRNTTVMSALAHGLPVVSFESLPGNFDGFSIPYGAVAPREDETAFVTKAVHFLGQKTDSNRRLENRRYFEAHFSWDRLASLYLSALNGKGEG